MRLLNTETLLLKKFDGDRIPPYAILSHTWLDEDDEVGFKDIGTPNVTQKSGYEKIKYLCEQARRENLSWAWCDTCCIDKDSSAELSESINSMFKWYQNAKICYAYLSDVFVEDPKDVQFKESRWFTRGWTLQELIAPETVRFYSHSWIFLGSKTGLCDYLAKITDVSAGALIWPWAVQSYSVARRMTWAVGRETTRPEDRAYSMLGILGVHIPLLYGEGNNAFRRLQEELIKNSDDESLFAHSGPNILATSPDDFYSSRVDKLPKNVSPTPNAITNLGLHISLRLLRSDKPSQDQTEAEYYGILSCHISRDFQNFLALPLKATSIPDVFVRVPGPLTKVSEQKAAYIEFRKIFIRFYEPYPHRVNFWLETQMEDYRLTARRIGDARVTIYGSTGQGAIYFDPKDPGYEGIRYEFSNELTQHRFNVMVVFDMKLNFAHIFTHTKDGDWEEALERRWLDGERSSLSRLEVETLSSENEVVKYYILASISSQKRLNKDVHVIQVWKENMEVAELLPGGG